MAGFEIPETTKKELREIYLNAYYGKENVPEKLLKEM